MVAALITMVLILVIGAWAYWATGHDWSVIAALVQAAVAFALVWATYSSIQRSDNQIDLALQQIQLGQDQFEVLQKQTSLITDQVAIAQKQLGYGTTPQFIIEVDENENTDGGLNIDIVNLSPFAIYISRILVDEVRAYPTLRRISMSSRSIPSASHVSAEFIDQSIVDGLNSLLSFTDFDYSEEAQKNQLENHDVRVIFAATNLSVEYFYGPTGNKMYRNDYSIEVYRLPKTVSIGRYWRIVLNPQGNYALLGDGSWKPTHIIDHHGNARPVESL